MIVFALHFLLTFALPMFLKARTLFRIVVDCLKTLRFCFKLMIGSIVSLPFKIITVIFEPFHRNMDGIVDIFKKNPVVDILKDNPVVNILKANPVINNPLGSLLSQQAKLLPDIHAGKELVSDIVNHNPITSSIKNAGNHLLDVLPHPRKNEEGEDVTESKSIVSSVLPTKLLSSGKRD